MMAYSRSYSCRLKEGFNEVKNFLHLFWLRIPYFRNYIISLRKQPPILILSFPRNGTSWVGAIIGKASKAQYLYEPITKALNRSPHNTIATFFKVRSPAFDDAAKAVFQGYPRANCDLIQIPHRWRFWNTINARLVVKEVSLLQAEVYRDYNPKIVFIHRHPAAVAKSLLMAGLLSDAQVPVLNKMPYASSLDFSSPLLLAASVYSFALHHAFMALKDYPELINIEFEALCREPVEGFKRIYEFVGLSFTPHIEAQVLRHAAGSDTDTYSVFKQTAAIPFRQCRGIDSEAMTRIREIWSRYGLPWYRTDEEWRSDASPTLI